jgi:hypothetical protein
MALHRPTTRSPTSNGLIALGAPGSLASTTLLITLAALAAAGCATRRHRYIDLTAPPHEALAAARTSAAAQGICPSEDGRTLVAIVKLGPDVETPGVPPDCDKQTPAEPPPPNPVSGLPPYTRRWIGLSAHERPGGTRLRLIGEPDDPLERILPDAPSHEYQVQRSFERQEVMVFEPMLRIGATFAGGRGFTEAECGGLAGARIWRRGGGELVAEPEHGLSLLVDLGVLTEIQRDVRAMIHDDELTYRIGVALQYDRVTTVSPLPGAHLKQGPRAVVRLTVDALRGKRDGVELGLSAQPVDQVGGLYARAGYQWGGERSDERGMTYSTGVELGQAPIATVAAIPVGLGLAYLLILVLAPRDPA